MEKWYKGQLYNWYEKEDTSGFEKWYKGRLINFYFFSIGVIQKTLELTSTYALSLDDKVNKIMDIFLNFGVMLSRRFLSIKNIVTTLGTDIEKKTQKNFFLLTNNLISLFKTIISILKKILEITALFGVNIEKKTFRFLNILLEMNVFRTLILNIYLELEVIFGITQSIVITSILKIIQEFDLIYRTITRKILQATTILVSILSKTAKQIKSISVNFILDLRFIIHLIFIVTLKGSIDILKWIDKILDLLTIYVLHLTTSAVLTFYIMLDLPTEFILGLLIKIKKRIHIVLVNAMVFNKHLFKIVTFIGEFYIYFIKKSKVKLDILLTNLISILKSIKSFYILTSSFLLNLITLSTRFLILICYSIFTINLVKKVQLIIKIVLNFIIDLIFGVLKSITLYCYSLFNVLLSFKISKVNTIVLKFRFKVLKYFKAIKDLFVKFVIEIPPKIFGLIYGLKDKFVGKIKYVNIDGLSDKLINKIKSTYIKDLKGKFKRR